jgi:hypothetical protein
LNEFESLLYKHSFIEKFQLKWLKNFSEGDIKIREDLYTLKVTENKRKLIYDSNNKFIGTIPFVINKFKEIINQ